MTNKVDHKNPVPKKELVKKPSETFTKASKVQEYVKKNFKSNRSNTKSVYTRPR
jgi:hypothetical protein